MDNLPFIYKGLLPLYNMRNIDENMHILALFKKKVPLLRGT